MCSCLVACHRHSDWTESWVENSRNFYFVTKIQRILRNTTERRKLWPTWAARRGSRKPCNQGRNCSLLPSCEGLLFHCRPLFHFSSAGVPPLPLLQSPPCRDASPEQVPGQALWQPRKWWCRGPERAGDQVSSEQTREKQIKQEVSWMQSYFSSMESSLSYSPPRSTEWKSFELENSWE